jgi:hypothetical protein
MSADTSGIFAHTTDLQIPYTCKEQFLRHLLVPQAFT